MSFSNVYFSPLLNWICNFLNKLIATASIWKILSSIAPDPPGFRKAFTLRFNIKSSLMKLLCTLMCLFEGTPFQPLWLEFLLHPLSTLLIAIFQTHDNITRGNSQRPSARSATQPAHHRDIAPLPNSQFLPPKLSSEPFCVAARRWRTSPLTSSTLTLSPSSSSYSSPAQPSILSFAKSSFHTLAFLLIWYLLDGRGRVVIF